MRSCARQASRRLVCCRCCCCAKAAHVQPAPASSSTTKIWIVLAASVIQHLPLSRHTSPLPPNASPPPKHIPTHTLLSCKSLQSTVLTYRSSQTKHCCAQGLASATPNVTCYPPSDLPSPPPLCSPIKTQIQTLFLSEPVQPHLWVFLSPSLSDSFSGPVLLSRFTICVLEIP